VVFQAVAVSPATASPRSHPARYSCREVKTGESGRFCAALPTAVTERRWRERGSWLITPSLVESIRARHPYLKKLARRAFQATRPASTRHHSAASSSSGELLPSRQFFIASGGDLGLRDACRRLVEVAGWLGWKPARPGAIGP